MRSLKDVKGIETFKGKFLWGNERLKTDSSRVNGFNEKKNYLLRELREIALL